jgi:hypothetical protein
VHFPPTLRRYLKKKKQKWVQVAHTVILATEETEIRKSTLVLLMSDGALTISTNKKLGVVEHNCHPNEAGGINRRVEVQA